MDGFRIPDLIIKKRNGKELTKEEIDFFVRCLIADANNNAIQESQIGAMLMAIYFKSMSFNEAFYLTQSMMNSGERFNFSRYRGGLVDKHSTGGVGDKISLPLAPALAACGLKVPMISGRGLGFTGGTLDKLESIPGFNASLPKSKIEELIEKVGCCIVGQTTELNPADRVLYATRDVTGTVDCVPLIAGSIVSKKAIEDLDALILDVKIGKAAFIKSQADAELLSEYMLEICKKLGFKAGVFITQHDDPLGYLIGNQFEIEETIECLHGRLPDDIRELVTKYGGYLLKRVKKVKSIEEGQAVIMEKLRNGEAREKFRQMIIAQGVNEALANELCINRNYNLVFASRAKYLSTIRAKETGFVDSINALELGLIGSSLGAGRAKAGDQISYEVGFKLMKKAGDRVEMNEPWLEVHHNAIDFKEQFEQRLIDAIEISKQPVKTRSNIVKIFDFD